MIDQDFLSNQQIKEIYYDVYNGFWKKYRDHVPEWRSAEWNRIVEHEKQLRRKHLSVCYTYTHPERLIIKGKK